MNLVPILIGLVIIIAVVAIFYWFVTRPKVAAMIANIPDPFIIIFYAIIAIVAILFLVNLAGFAGQPIINLR